MAADIKSHIIPRCEQKRLKQGEEKYVYIDPSARRQKEEHSSRFWQRSMLCQDCEDRCANLDAFWAKFVDQHGQFQPGTRSRSPRVIAGVDARQVGRFLLSVLLRAHASNLPEFASYSLGTAFRASRASLQGDDPFALGFRLLAQVAWSQLQAHDFRALPHAAPSGKGAVLWFGGFRFCVGFPGARWDDKLVRLSTHPEPSGLRVTGVQLERTQEYLQFIAVARKLPRASNRHHAK